MLNTILRSLIVWLVLLAVPFQGFASAAMLACGPGHAVPAVGAAPGAADGHHMLHDAAGDMSGHEHASMAHGAPDEPEAPGHGNGHACSACSACSIGATIAPAGCARRRAGRK